MKPCDCHSSLTSFDHVFKYIQHTHTYFSNSHVNHYTILNLILNVYISNIKYIIKMVSIFYFLLLTYLVITFILLFNFLKINRTSGWSIRTSGLSKPLVHRTSGFQKLFLTLSYYNNWNVLLISVGFELEHARKMLEPHRVSSARAPPIKKRAARLRFY